MAPDEDKVAVRCKGLVKSFGEGPNAVQALRGIDVEVGLGEVVMLVGPSGCGKTTLISIMASVLDQDGGHCRVLGADLERLSASQKAALRRTRIGFVFQSYNLIPSLSVAENVAIPLFLNRSDRKTALTEAEAMLKRLGLEGRGGARPRELSGGQQQRVAVARALIHQPSLLVCDEPTSALDARTGDDLMRLLRDIALEASRAIIIVTHDNRILKYADRIAEMDDGRITHFSGTG
ncbi:ABC transporter ATP-binding protein [Reyranella sp.]|uniref:ABC transporter ATP-binding protein n=1 Tax=Reyranella sp. TaxID=1929291 RepID=UPI003BAD480A